MNQIIDIGEKTPDEYGRIQFDFTDKLDGEDVGSISSVLVYEIVSGGAEIDKTSTMYNSGNSTISGKSAYPWILGGEHGKRYLVICEVISADSGQLRAGYARFLVNDPLETV